MVSLSGKVSSDGVNGNFHSVPALRDGFSERVLHKNFVLLGEVTVRVQDLGRFRELDQDGVAYHLHVVRALFDTLAAVVLDVARVSRVDGSVEAFPRVQSNGVFMPGADHTQASMTVLHARSKYKQQISNAASSKLPRLVQKSLAILMLTSISPIDNGPPVSAYQRKRSRHINILAGTQPITHPPTSGRCKKG